MLGQQGDVVSVEAPIINLEIARPEDMCVSCATSSTSERAYADSVAS